MPYMILQYIFGLAAPEDLKKKKLIQWSPELKPPTGDRKNINLFHRKLKVVRALENFTMKRRHKIQKITEKITWHLKQYSNIFHICKLIVSFSGRHKPSTEPNPIVLTMCGSIIRLSDRIRLAPLYFSFFSTRRDLVYFRKSVMRKGFKLFLFWIS